MHDTNTPNRRQADPGARLTGQAFLKRTSWAVLITGAVAALVVAVRWGSSAGLGFLIGLVWGLGNFWGLAWVTQALAHPTNPDRVKALRAGFFKFFLYAAGILLLWWNAFPLLALVSGFSWLLVVLVLRAGGAMLVYRNLDQK